MIYSEFIRSTISNSNGIHWNYYENALNTNNILQSNNSQNFICDYFENGGKPLPLLVNPMISRNFIDDYFVSGRKDFVLSFLDDEQYNLPDDRAIHTVSGFFLGLLIENCLNGANTLAVNSLTDFPFSYLWFLTFLYHDYGYCVAERTDTLNSFPKTAPIPRNLNSLNMRASFSEYRALLQIKTVLGIDLSPFSDFSANNSLSKRFYNMQPCLEHALLKELTMRNNTITGPKKLSFNNGSKISGPQYQSSLITRYLNYCINERNRVDHGIVGGYLFYDRIIKNYMFAYMSLIQEQDNLPDLADFDYSNRHFGKEQLKIFSYIADCILAHNIWKQPDNLRALYEKYQLYPLFSENYKPITFEENPLLYILVVTDSIEPTKIYNKYSAQQVADAINIEYRPGSRCLNISCQSDTIDIKKIYHKAKGLEEWTSARCSNLYNEQFELYI